ncbi:hypothetical protein QTO30_12815 [Yoonia sp. GPGPB17]|uniref:hypothetical protein n=1 Tax=Yoonia sp. GPGPB17 TaxID=3026147 RepID=UPI0030C17F14
MLKQTFLNAVFTGGAQAVSLVVIVALAAVLDAAVFGALSIQLSLAAVLSILCTLQFERVYVRVRTAALARYIAFHIFCLACVSAGFLAVAIALGIGQIAVLLAAATGLSQIALYGAARQGLFVRIWVMKAVQATSLLGLSAIIYAVQQDTLYWIAFVGSYFGAGLFALDQPTRHALFHRTLRHDIRRAAYSARIAAMALGSLLAGSFTREFPVILSGALGLARDSRGTGPGFAHRRRTHWPAGPLGCGCCIKLCGIGPF